MSRTKRETSIGRRGNSSIIGVRVFQDSPYKTRWDMLEILRLLVKYGPLLRQLIKVFDLPDFGQGQSVRDWLRLVVEFGKGGSQMTPILVDDKVVEALSQIVENDETWAVVWQIINSFTGDELRPRTDKVSRVEVIGLATELGIDPDLIVQIIQLIIELIQAFWGKK